MSDSFDHFVAALDPIFVLVLLALVALSFVLVRYVLVPALYRAMDRTATTWDNILKEKGFFRQFAFLAPAIVLYFGVGYYPSVTTLARQIILIYIVVNVVVVLDRFLSAGLEIYRQYPVSLKRPIKAYIQLAKLVIYIIGAVTCIALLLGKSPWGVLGGIGAITAVLILVFRNTILSLIASIQLVANDLIHRGDWVELPQYGADGEVIDIALHVVRVQNWDKTIVTIPSYKLMDDSFKNWRGMQETGGRRIKRSVLIDQTSVQICDAAMLEKYARIDRLKPHLAVKKEEIKDVAEPAADDSVPMNRRRLTNLGVFRAYALAYLKENPKLSDELPVVVRHLQPTPNGLPLEIYAFSKEIDQVSYENVQADIFDHLLAVLPFFDLKVFQNPTGENFRLLNRALDGQAQWDTVT